MHTPTYCYSFHLPIFRPYSLILSTTYKSLASQHGVQHGFAQARRVSVQPSADDTAKAVRDSAGEVWWRPLAPFASTLAFARPHRSGKILYEWHRLISSVTSRTRAATRRPPRLTAGPRLAGWCRTPTRCFCPRSRSCGRTTNAASGCAFAATVSNKLSAFSRRPVTYLGAAFFAFFWLFPGPCSAGSWPRGCNRGVSPLGRIAV